MFWYHLILIIALGLIVGSFITSYTHRVAKGLKVSKGRSICPNCKKKITWYDNIPVISYLILRGKCRKCSEKISLRYPLIEILTSLVFVLIYIAGNNCLSYPQSLFPVSNTICMWYESIGLLVLPYFLFVCFALIATFITDYEHQMIPDTLSYSLFVLTFVMLIIVSPQDLYLRLFTGFFLSFSLLILHLVTLGRGMGLGDVKLVIFAGILLGWQLSIVWIFSSFILGAMVGVLLIAVSKAKFGKQIAFGPFLIASFFLTIFFGNWLMDRFFPYLI